MERALRKAAQDPTGARARTDSGWVTRRWSAALPQSQCCGHSGVCRRRRGVVPSDLPVGSRGTWGRSREFASAAEAAFDNGGVTARL